MQRLFFQITITLNPIIIHKLWEKNFHQSWWEIKVRRPRHGHDSIFPNTLQRPPLGPVPVTRFKRLTFSLWLWPGDVSDVTPRRCEAKWRPLLVWPERSRSLFTGARHGAGARFQRHLAPGDWPLLLRRRRTRATEQTHFFSDYPENTFGVWYVSLESGRRFDDWWISTKSKYTGLVSVFCFGTDCDPIWFLALIIFTLSN